MVKKQFFIHLMCVLFNVYHRMEVQDGQMRPTVTEEEEKPPETLLR